MCSRVFSQTCIDLDLWKACDIFDLTANQIEDTTMGRLVRVEVDAIRDLSFGYLPLVFTVSDDGDS